MPREWAVDMLLRELADGPVAVERLKRRAKAVAVGWRTVERAKEQLGVESVKEGFAGTTWGWRLAAPKTATDEPPPKTATSPPSSKTATPPCRYEHHRRTDWRKASGGVQVCGVCHPPARGLEVVAA